MWVNLLWYKMPLWIQLRVTFLGDQEWNFSFKGTALYLTFRTEKHMAKKQEAGIKVHFNRRHVQPDGLVPAPQLQYAFSPLQSYFDWIPSPNKNKTSIIYAILMHTTQFTSPHSPCTDFLYTSHGVKRSKILPGRDTTPSCPALESKKSLKQGTDLEGFFLLATPCLFPSLCHWNCLSVHR